MNEKYSRRALHTSSMKTEGSSRTSEGTTNERPASVGIIEKQNLVILVNVISQSFVPAVVERPNSFS